MDFQMITLSQDETEELIRDNQGLDVAEFQQSTVNMNYESLLTMGEVLIEYHLDLSRLQDVPDLERHLNEWMINLQGFPVEETNDQVSALVNQNLTLIYDIKWKLSEGDGSKSLSIGHMALTSSVKATSGWLNVNNHENAQFCHQIASKFAEHLEDSEEFFIEDLSTQERAQLRKEHLLFLLNCVEILQARGDSNQAKHYLEMVTANLEPPVTPQYLASLTYNFAVDAYEAGDFSGSSEWLEAATHFLGTENCSLKVKVCKLYGQVYLQMDSENYWENAANAFQMAFLVKQESEILVSLTKCVLFGGKTLLVKEFLENTLIPQIHYLEHKDAEKIISLLMDKNYSALACQLLSNSYLDGLFSFRCKALTLLKTGWIKETETLLENWHDLDCIDEDLVRTILEQTSKAMVENKNAEKWMRFALIATRNVADKETEFRYEEIYNLLLKQTFYIQLQNIREKEANISRECLQFDQSNSLDIFLQMKMKLLENREDEFMEIISQLADTAMGLHFESKEFSALFLACSAAIDLGSKKALKICLKKLLSRKSNDPVIKLNAHRCLVRLMAENSDELEVSEILQTMDESRLITQLTRNQSNQYNPMVLWYERIFWNMALKRKPKESYQIMLGCSRLISEGDLNDQALLIRRETIILHTIAVALQMSRLQSDYDVIETAIQFCEQLKLKKSLGLSQYDQLSTRLLFFYEFEAIAFKNEESVLDHMWERSYSQIDYAACKILVGILMEQGHKYHSLLIKIVLTTLHKGLERNIYTEETWNFTRYALNLILNSSKSEYTVYINLNQLVQCVCRFHQTYTETQLQVLASISWNRGVYNLSKRDEMCEKYFSLSLKLARQTGLSKTPVAAKFNDLQEDILSFQQLFTS